jgi:hypothetical protein
MPEKRHLTNEAPDIERLPRAATGPTTGVTNTTVLCCAHAQHRVDIAFYPQNRREWAVGQADAKPKAVP